MPPLSSSKSDSAARGRPLRVGFLPLTDAAPLIVAQELGFFARRGIRVDLSREVGWATIREKIVYGELDAAHAPAPMLWDVRLGLSSTPCPVLTGFVLNLHGNALTLSERLYIEGVRDSASLRDVVRSRRGERRLTLGVVFPFSSHHLHLRAWLLQAGINPEKDVRIVVVPPAQMFRNLTAGTIEGYCAGEPWNSLAVRAGAGWCPMWTAAQSPGHVEKVLMVTEHFAATRAAEHAGLVAALYEAAAWCEQPENREPLAELLASARYINVPARVISPALSGRFDCGHGRTETVSDFIVFHSNGANFPGIEKAETIQHELVAANLLPATTTPDLPRRLFRDDILRAAFPEHLHHAPISSPCT
jgi:ABC-type nitrate/sulfonate/bicarbonate transport system substrate-binding protein